MRQLALGVDGASHEAEDPLAEGHCSGSPDSGIHGRRKAHGSAVGLHVVRDSSVRSAAGQGRPTGLRRGARPRSRSQSSAPGGAGVPADGHTMGPNSNGRATQTHPQTPRSDRRHRNSLRMHAQSAPTYAAPWPRSCNTCRAPVTCVATILSRVSKEVARSSDLADVHRLAVMRAEVLVLIATRVQGRGAQDILAPVGGSEARCNML